MGCLFSRFFLLSHYYLLFYLLLYNLAAGWCKRSFTCLALRWCSFSNPQIMFWYIIAEAEYDIFELHTCMQNFLIRLHEAILVAHRKVDLNRLNWILGKKLSFSEILPNYSRFYKENVEVLNASGPRGKEMKTKANFGNGGTYSLYLIVFAVDDFRGISIYFRH